MAGTGRKVWVADEILAADDLQSYIQDQVVFVYANSTARASGILSPTEGMVSYLTDTNLLYTFDGSNWVEVAPNVGTAGTYTKVTTDAKGRVTSGTTLSAGDIPSLDASKITAGTLTRPLNTTTVDTTGNITSGGQIYGASMLTPTISGGVDWNISDAGGGRFDAGVQSAGIYNNAVSGLAVYVSSGGVLGKGASTERVKDDIVDATLNVDAVRNIRIRNFIYKPEFVESDGSVQIGVIAEELIALGLDEFVFFEDGEPSGVHYDKLALAALALLQVESARLDSLEARLDKLEK